MARAYGYLENIRRDLYMKLGKYLAEHCDAVITEGIKVKQLIGEGVRKLRMRLQDVGFHKLKEIIKYQVEKCGKEFRLVDPAFNSKKCARCGYVNKDLTLEDSIFICPKCNWVADRDNSSILNMLRSAGWEPPLEPVELHPLPVANNGHGGAVKQEAPPFRAGQLT